jgi:hypothetical protein
MNGPFLIALLALTLAATAAEPEVIDVDWEPACGGSNIRITTVAGRMQLVEAFAEHHAEAREWICAFKDGVLLSATFRHYKISRDATAETGEFNTTMTLEKITVFAVVDGALDKMEPSLRTDLDEVLDKAKAGLDRARSRQRP